MIYLVQTGLLAEIGRFQSLGPQRYIRDSEVVCRTPRGLEIGCVITESAADQAGTSGTLLRRVTDDDRMIIKRIDRFKNRAFKACQSLLVDEKIPAMLVDVEHLFDGESVFFYFLGKVPDGVERVSGRLAEIYEAKVKFRQFAERLASGCGPGCGTTASKCGDGGCSNCGIAGGCGTVKKERR